MSHEWAYVTHGFLPRGRPLMAHGFLPPMQTIQQQLQACVHAALAGTSVDLGAVAPEVLQVVPCANLQFGDYQFNGALPLAKALKTNPRALAQEIIEKLEVGDVSETPEIAGPGFINFRLKNDYLEKMIAGALADPRLGVPTAEVVRTVVVDYPSPNVAKPMHVGHIRTMFIGDAIARVLRFAGHKVISDNHVGDWGTPIGMVIWGWSRYREDAKFQQSPLDEMGRIYKLVKAQTKENKAILTAVREETAKLHAGDEATLATWKFLREASLPELDKVYEQLDIHVDETLGESFYHDQLATLVDDFKAKGIAEESEGAIVIKFDEPPHLRDKPMLIQKGDGGYLYATTDLATIDYRIKRWNPDEIVYVVDARQSDHFRQLFAAVKKWDLQDVRLEHIAFGTILGDDGTPIKTKEGDPPRLDDLLSEAQSRAAEIARSKNPDLSEDRTKEISRVLGIGALKYADLCQNRTSDYQFSWDRMLALSGNSAVYLEYAYVRTRSIFRRAQEELGSWESGNIVLQEAAEIELAKFLLRFPLTIEAALNDYRMNAICDYLFELAQKFTGFYDACPVLKSESPLRESRLALVQLTGDVLKQGLNLLGIETIEQM